MTYPTFTVTVTREDNLWVAIVTDGLDVGAIGAADFEHFADIDPGMREIIADLTGIEPEQFNVTWLYEFGGTDATGLVREFQDAERMAKELAKWRDEARARLVAEMKNGKLSQRAIADLLGLSHQRVHQISHTTFEVDTVIPSTFHVGVLSELLSRAVQHAPESTEYLPALWYTRRRPTFDPAKISEELREVLDRLDDLPSQPEQRDERERSSR